MGIDIHALNFLRYVTKKRKLGRVATIGRQSLLVSRRELARVLGVPWKDTNLGLYSEELLKKHFGATHVDSYDYSGYEGATHVADLGRPIVPEQQYDTVIDCGTAEHIFDVSQVLRNLSCLCPPIIFAVMDSGSSLLNYFSRFIQMHRDTAKPKFSWRIYATKANGSRSSSQNTEDALK
jgi:hypothetical protein